MFCEKCGAKNDSDAKFCVKCGQSLEPLNNENNILNKLKKLPKKTKVVMLGVIFLVIIASIVLLVLLNNPIKKVEDGFKSFYDNYEKNNINDLKDIKKVVNDNLNDRDVLKQIDETSDKIITSWVKNFNIDYKDKDELNKSYDKVNNALKDVYTYFNGLSYILDIDTYNEYINELDKLYTSKNNYLYAVKSEDDYAKYSYYLRVIESDSYYKEANKFINDYVKEELNVFLNESANIVKFEENTNNSTKLEAYKEELKFIKDNKIRNNVDLSATEDYQKLYNDTLNNILNSIKDVWKKKKF